MSEALREEIEALDRQRRKLQSEIDSLRVDAQRRDKLGTAEAIYRAGWASGWGAGWASGWGAGWGNSREYDVPQDLRESDWEVYQLDRART